MSSSFFFLASASMSIFCSMYKTRSSSFYLKNKVVKELTMDRIWPAELDCQILLT
ncbi:hypothetical protein BpHYR1_050874 [Brachionus plicatilis]|uniref:Uncharacterized protein n=1 Tax=Brachionus plicatilis TaxID=10195 RepID=A0A3M7P2A2_BRAPC|nr:hypothetical protein BpHYR1_050874 [Brachionus plicatilis]